MADAFKLTILTPEKEFYAGEVAAIVTGSTEGGIEILPDHMPLITTLKPSVTEITEKGGKKLKAFTSTGLLEVKDNNVRILCDACEWPEEIDFKRAEESKKRAEERLNSKDGTDVKRAEIALSRALARIKLK